MLACASSSALAARGFEVRDLATLDRVSSPTLSPDGRRVVFAKRVMDFAANKASTVAVDRGPVRARRRAAGAPHAGRLERQFAELLARRQDRVFPQRQVRLDAAVRDPGRRRHAEAAHRRSPPTSAATSCRRTASASPSTSKPSPTARPTWPARKKKHRRAQGQQKNTGVVFDRIFVRHWDTWNDGRLQPRCSSPTLGATARPATRRRWSAATSIGDVPSRPFGDSSEYTWSPDGKSLVFSARIADAKEPWSTNFDLYQVNADGTRRREEPDRRQSRLGHRPGVQRRRQDAVLPRDEAPGLRGRPLRADGDGPGAAARRREIAPHGTAPPTASRCPPTARRSTPPRSDLGEHPLFAVDIASGKADASSSATARISAFDLAGPTLAFTRNTLKTRRPAVHHQRRRRRRCARSRTSDRRDAAGRGVRRLRAVQLQGLERRHRARLRGQAVELPARARSTRSPS